MKISKLVLSFILSISLFSGMLSAQMASTEMLVGHSVSSPSKDKLA